MANQQQHPNHGLNKTKVAVVMVPFPAQGHLKQVLHLSHLILAYNIPIHYACTATHNHQAMLRVHGWDLNSVSDIHFHDLKIPPFLTPSLNPNAPNKFPSHLQPLLNASLHLRDPMASLLRELSSKATRIIVINDSLMGLVVQDLVTIPNAESYTFYTLELDPYSEITTKDLPSLEGCFTTEFQKLSSRYLYNTCRVIEGAYMDLMEKIEGDKKHWAIGPFNPVRNIGSNKRHKCLEWLDKESPNSGIYQIKELAIGLEKSEQKFIWALRDADKGDVFINGELRKAEIPKGFEERVKGRGWYITMGVPVVAWPMASDQPRNTVLITKLLKVGIVVNDWSRRDELAMKLLMASEEGDEIRKRAVDLGGAIEKSIEEGGVPRMELDSFITHITR
ncbi:hypothetical protein ACB094_09G169700 [Castanea mollissima]